LSLPAAFKPHVTPSRAGTLIAGDLLLQTSPSSEESIMQVSQTMACDVRVANPEQSICNVAQVMAD